MTIVAMDCGTRLFLGADSLATGVDGSRTLALRIRTLQAPPLAWGIAGATHPGDRFDAWLRSRPWQSRGSWDALARAARDVLTRENETYCEARKAAGLMPCRADRAEVLAVGYIGDERRVLYLPAWDEVIWATGERIFAIGPGAQAACRIRVNMGPFGAELAHFLHVLNLTARTAEGCGPPVRGFEISRSGVREIDLSGGC